jgi:hypothetical protein
MWVRCPVIEHPDLAFIWLRIRRQWTIGGVSGEYPIRPERSGVVSEKGGFMTTIMRYQWVYFLFAERSRQNKAFRAPQARVFHSIRGEQAE